MSKKIKKRKSEKRFPMLLIILVMFLCVYFLVSRKENRFSEGNPQMQKLLNSYPEYLGRIEGNYLIWKDETKMEISDSIDDKSFEGLLENPSLIDQFKWAYRITDTVSSIEKNFDPGRVRYLPFFQKMYGETKREVEENLVEIIWMPKTINQKLLVTSINRVDEKLKSISDELDEIPSLKKYLEKPGGTFNWRKISGTKRLSPHSFGMTIDINVKYSNYWQWDCKCKDEFAELEYKNSIPMRIVRIFEKHGFIWGGRWYHYDTMHFEYRPELIYNLPSQDL